LHYGPVYVIQAQNGQVFLIHDGYGGKKKDGLIVVDPPKLIPKFKVGDKVVPISKSVGCSLEHSDDWEEGKEQGYLFMKTICPETDKGIKLLGHWCAASMEKSSSSCFLESDLIPYVEPKSKPRGFKVGDRVRVVSDTEHWGYKFIGETGAICVIGSNCGINFDKNLDGHSCNGNCETGHGFYLPFADIKLITPSSNLCPAPHTEKYIYNGPATVCIIEQDGKQYKGVVKCYYKDIWSEQIGRQEAYKKALEQITNDNRSEQLGPSSPLARQIISVYSRCCSN
jgi:hypothetical protein